MIYVCTENYRQFQNFLQAHELREDFGTRCNVDGCKRGQVRYLAPTFEGIDRLRGNRNILVLVWGTADRAPDFPMIVDYCASIDVPLVWVPEPARARAIREHPEQLLQW